MPRYTVEDTNTGKRVTFDWEGVEAPTEVEMEEIFSSAGLREDAAPQQPIVPTEKTTLGMAPTTDLEAGERMKPFAAMTEPPGAGIPLQPAHEPIQEERARIEAQALQPVYPETAAAVALTTAGVGPAAAALLAEPMLQSVSEEIHDAVKNPIVATALDVGLGMASGRATDFAGKAAQAVATGRRAAKISKLKTEYKRTVIKGMEKGIKPSVRSVPTASRRKRYFQKAQLAVDTIIRNKPNLKLVDEAGEAIDNVLPENLRQFTQAIDQTKRRVFIQYNEMAKKAGIKGASVQLRPVTQELNKIARSKSIQDLRPAVAEYAKARADVLWKRRFYRTEEAQEAITMLNQSLEAFYKNPNYDTASMAYIDSLIANKLREGLDTVIEKTVAPGYQELKKAYGALKTIERDVNRRMIVNARRDSKGLIDFADIVTAERAMTAIMRMDPVAAGQSATIKIIKDYIKWMNDPNKIVKKMFENAEKIKTQLSKTQ